MGLPRMSVMDEHDDDAPPQEVATMAATMSRTTDDPRAAVVDSRLPSPSSDPATWVHDLETYGYCIVKDALSADFTERLLHRSLDQAAAEVKAGVSSSVNTAQAAKVLEVT